MSYDLSFTQDFFIGFPEGVIGETDIRTCYPVSERPQSVMQALVSEEKLNPIAFKVMVKETLGIQSGPYDESVFWDLLDKIRDYNTCDTLIPPIAVFVNEDHSVTVYEDIEEEIS